MSVVIFRACKGINEPEVSFKLISVPRTNCYILLLVQMSEGFEMTIRTADTKQFFVKIEATVLDCPDYD